MPAAVLVIASVVVFGGLIVGVAISVWKSMKRKAERSGAESMGAYLRTAPVTDEEKRDAVDLALTGVAICLVGLLFPPILLVGLFPLYYGARKVAYAMMGLGFVDDANSL